MRILLLTLMLSLAALGPLSAQKYGHLNFGNLISQMPGTEQADAELKTYNDELVAEGERMVTALRERVTEIEGQIDDLPPVRVEELRAELNAEREKIGQYEQQVAVNLQNRRRELLGPIIEQARTAITEVAEAEGYTLVFDTSQFNTVLFAEDATDLMPLVKAKLGL